MRALSGLALALVVIFAGAPGVALAQTPSLGASSNPTGEPPPPTIRKVIIKFTGIANVTEDIVRANMSLREGMPYDENLVDRDIRSLYRTELFEFINIVTTNLPDNQVDVTFELRPKPRIAAVRFEGNKRVSTRRLQGEITIRQSVMLDERRVKDDADKILAYYRKSGYSQARVDYVIDRNPVTGFGTVTFKIDEGNRVRISKIDFVGNEQIKDGPLLKQMETGKWWFFSWLTGSGKYDDKKFEEDLDKVRDYYIERGFLDVEIKSDAVTFAYPTNKTMTITIPVKEGKQYHIGEISVTGTKLFPAELVRRVIKVQTGDVFSPEKLDKEIENLENFYGQFGYLDTRARLERHPNVQTGAIDLTFAVNESERFTVESVSIEGNTKTKSIVVLREILLAPGDVFDKVRMETSKNRLENTRFFEDVNVRDEPTNIPNRKNLKISFHEGRTGNLTFGAGFSSVEKAVFFIELSQSNFDLFNRRSFFQGDGQKFRLKAQVGSQSSELVLAFEEPWLFEQELALGFQVYRTESDYTSSIYNELREGFEVYLRKRLFELVEGRLSYRLENVDIFDVSGSLSQDILRLLGKSTVSKIGLTLLRDTRDNLITTTRGSQIQGIFEIAGGPLGADENYYRLEGQVVQYFPLFDFQQQVLEVAGRLGTVQEYGNSPDVPFYDRYFLGGPTAMRGFDYRKVGPKDQFDEPIGGKTVGYLSLEYSIDIVHPVRFAAFYEAGLLNRGSFDFNPAGFNDDFGIGIRFFVLGSPLRLDYGIPLTTEGKREGNQFNFSFGTRF